MLQYYLGRQPIFDARLKVVGYELLYRSLEHTEAVGVVDGNLATSQVLFNSLIEIGLARVVGDHRAFVNLTRYFLLNQHLLPPPSNQLVLEVLEDTVVDDELVQAIVALKGKGYLIALDDYCITEQNLKLLEYADIVKLDLRKLDAREMRRHVLRMRDYPLKLLAEKIETPDEFDWCRGLGFDYYQGFFLCRPRLLSGRQLPLNRLNTMRMMAKIHDDNVEVNELEQIISQDATLSYKLLKYINSAAFGPGREIESIRHAIVYLGENEVRRWAGLIALTAAEDKPGELFMTSLTRSKMCELLADNTGRGNTRTAFMIGLLSTIDAIMDAPLAELLEPLPLARDVTDTLLRHEGKYAELLDCTLAYEMGDWERVQCPGLPRETISEIYLQSIEWAETAIHALGDRR